MDMQFEPTGFGWAGNALAMMAPTSMPPSAFAKPTAALSSTMDPYYVSKDAIERFGQVTPPEDLTPDPRVNANGAVGSPSMDMPMNASPWTTVQQMRDLQAYDPSLSPPQPQEPSLQCSSGSDSQRPALRTSKRRRTTTTQFASANDVAPEPTPASHDLTLSASSPQHPQPAQAAQAPKRKRGRPKSQPQLQSEEALAIDGYPFPVSSARQSHLEKNRLAAHKCRQRRKEYINSLETRARDFSAQNQTLKDTVSQLREQVLGLKDVLLQHAGCGCWAIDEYLKRSAGDLLGIGNPTPDRQDVSAFCNTQSLEEQIDTYDKRRDSALLAETPHDMADDQGDFVDMGLLNDFDDGDDNASND